MGPHLKRRLARDALLNIFLKIEDAFSRRVIDIIRKLLFQRKANLIVITGAAIDMKPTQAGANCRSHSATRLKPSVA